MARTKGKNGIFSVILWLAIIIGACALVMNFVTTQEIFGTRNFAVELNEKELVNGSGDIELIQGKKYVFKVLNAETEEQDGYTVKIVSNTTKQTDFYYTLEEEWLQYSKVTEDLTNYFTIEAEKESFSIVADHDIGEILNLVHGENVSLANNVIDSTTDYFTMIVSRADGSESISLNFRIGYTLRLDKERLEF